MAEKFNFLCQGNREVLYAVLLLHLDEGRLPEILIDFVVKFQENDRCFSFLSFLPSVCRGIREEERVFKFADKIAEFFGMFDLSKINQSKFEKLSFLDSNLCNLSFNLRPNIPGIFYEKLMEAEITFHELLIRSENLKKRCLGFNWINNNLIFLRNLELKRINLYSAENTENYVNLTRKVFSDLLKRIDALDLILGPNSHEAIVKLAAPIIIFLYNSLEISFKDIVQIWSTSSQRDDAVGEALLQMVSMVVMSLKLNDCWVKL